jgi:hypothetical protein
VSRPEPGDNTLEGDEDVLGNSQRILSASLAVICGAFFLLPAATAQAADNHGAKIGRTSLERIDQAYRDGRLDFEASTLLRVRALVKPSELPAEFRSAEMIPSKCGTEAVVAAVRDKDRLSPAGQAQLAADISRPSTSEYFDSPDGYFRIHYNVSGTHAVPLSDGDGDSVPDYVENLADYCDSSWRQEVINYGYFGPPSDGGVGGNSAYDIYCQNIGAYGWCAPEEPGPEPWNDYSSHIVVHNNFYGFPPNDDPDGDQAGAAKATVAHEFQHACQFAYDVNESGSWMEMTATWMEDEVFDPVNDNYNYLSYFFNDPEVPLMLFSGLHPYAAFIWPRYLSEVYGTGIVLDIWQECISGSATNGFETALGGAGSSSNEAFADFAKWNWITGSRDDGLHYEEGSHYPLISLLRTHATYPVLDQTSSQAPGGLATNYIQLSAPAGMTNRPFKISFAGDEGFPWAAGLVARTSGGTFEFLDLPLDTNGTGSLTLPAFTGYTYLVLVPARLDASSVSANYTYSACVGPLAPVPLSPTGGETATTPVALEWDAVGGAVSYHLQVDDDSTFASPEIDSVVTGYTYSADGLEQDMVHYWRVSVTDGCGESGWSQTADFRATCGVAMTGDVDLDGSLAASDIIYLVNYAFKGGADPQPIAQAGDVTCDGSITASDIILMVAHVFKSGPDPCDVCSIL